MLKHHQPTAAAAAASGVIITDGYANAADIAATVGDHNNTARTINNENNKQSNVIKYISSMHGHSIVGCGVGDEMNLNLNMGPAAIAAQPPPPAIHVYAPSSMMGMGHAVAAPNAFQYTYPVLGPQSIQSIEQHNRIAMLSSGCGEQKAPIEQVFYDLPSNTDNSFAVLHNASLHHPPPPTTASTASIYTTNIDGTRYGGSTLAGVAPPSTPHHQLMREFIMTSSSHPNRSGYAHIDGYAPAYNDIAVHQPHHQFNMRQVPVYNKPFGSNAERLMSVNSHANVPAVAVGSASGADRPPGLRELLFGNKHVDTNDNPNINEVREKTDTFNNRLHEYAKFKEQQFDEHTPTADGGLYNNAYLRRLYGIDDGNEQQLNRPENDHKTASTINQPNRMTSGGVDYRAGASAAAAAAAAIAASSPLATRLKDIPENDKVNDYNDQDNVNDAVRKFDIASSVVAVDGHKSSFALDPLLFSKRASLHDDDGGHDEAAMASVSTATAAVAADASRTPTKTGLAHIPTTPQRTLAFDLSKNATYPFERDENTAYLEDIADDSHSEDSIEIMEKQIESLKLDETKKPEIAPRKLSLADSMPSSRRSSIQTTSAAHIDAVVEAARISPPNTVADMLAKRRESISR